MFEPGTVRRTPATTSVLFRMTSRGIICRAQGSCESATAVAIMASTLDCFVTLCMSSGLHDREARSNASVLSR